MAGSTTIGSVKYDAVIDISTLKSSISVADSMVEQSYKKQTKSAQQASKDITSTSSKDAQTRVNAVKAEAEQTASTISKYSPQIQKQFLAVERANNRVASATVRAQGAVQKYGSGSFQAANATNSLSVAVQDQSQKQGRLQSLLDGSEKSTNRFSSAMQSAGVIAGATAAVVGTVLYKAINSITSSVSGAVKRVDTLRNAGRTFENMGIGANESARAMSELQKSIEGLPTTLDSAVSGMTALTATYGDINKGQKIFTALNNAILGFGGTSDMVNNAIQQLSQLPMDGPLDAQTWNSLRNSGITPVLVAMARESGMSVSQMKEAFGQGQLTVQDFTDRLIALNESGGGGLKSLEQIAKDSTDGIGTGFTNMQTAITRATAKVIEAIGSENISGAVSGVGKAIASVLNSIVPLVEFVKRNKDFFAPWAVGVGVIIGLLTGMVAVTKALTIAQAAYNVVMAANPIGLIIVAVAGLVAALVYFFTQTEIGKKIFETAFGTIKDIVVSVFNWVKDNWPLLLGIITGPIGLAVLTIIKNFDTIKQVVGNVWDWVKGVFSTIGSIATTIIKAPVNAIISFAENTINGFIKAVNGAIGSINNIPGVSIGKLGTINIPKLAEGGIVRARPGGVLANIAEGGEAEAVIPLSKLEKLMGSSSSSQNVTVHLSLSGVMTSSKSDERAIATRIAKLINETVKSKTGSPAIAGV